MGLKTLVAQSQDAASPTPPTRAECGFQAVRSRFDTHRGLGAVPGVPALAGSVLSLERGAKYLEIQVEPPSHQLKPELHTRCPPHLCEINGFRDLPLFGHRPQNRSAALTETGNSCVQTQAFCALLEP